ncbi:MAG: glycosyltransferase family 9 protein [Sedimentisphaerales bacterium]|nr:glycosyltransferase family 9 protein [Sedimentisphaerales bacterium]
MPESYKNILIMKPSALGDIVLALPALAALRSSFPDAKISWLVRPEFSPLLENHPYIDEIILFDRKSLGRAWCCPKSFGALIRLISQLRKSKFDAIFDFQGLFRTAALARLSGCKKRFGKANSRELAHLFYTDQIEQDSESIHLVDFYLKMVEAAGAKNPGVRFELPSSPAVLEAAKKLLADSGLRPGKYVVFIPGSAHKDKCWPVENFASLADKIASQFKMPIIAIGSNSEKPLAEKINSLAETSVINFAGRTSLKELVEILRAASLVVSNDTGPGHIAAALGVPLVIMYSWSNPARIAPYGRPQCMVAREPYGRGLKIKSINQKHNVSNITVDEVFQKVTEQLKRDD